MFGINRINLVKHFYIQDSKILSFVIYVFRLELADKYKKTGNYNKIYIKKYIDYTNKYGLGFVFSNNWHGVYFNDET